MLPYDIPAAPVPYSLHAEASSRYLARMPLLTRDPTSLRNQRKAWALLAPFHWQNHQQFRCLVYMWDRESGLRTNSNNGDGYGTWGLPQAHPGNKMATYGSDWRTNPITQIRWGLHYIKSTYGSPCQAWSFWQNHSWY
jgi:hypothetical protein